MPKIKAKVWIEYMEMMSSSLGSVGTKAFINGFNKINQNRNNSLINHRKTIFFILPPLHITDLKNRTNCLLVSSYSLSILNSFLIAITTAWALLPSHCHTVSVISLAYSIFIQFSSSCNLLLKTPNLLFNRMSSKVLSCCLT